ncbi:chromosome-associated kinesin KIF4A-like isoform X2 [Watersipora subatra]|uniref:chromosome-associated kinesin KIF4A-like isoform X2 n=1 Tax=Watersipora subatra TaxID=2589382 RepID=UPI00355BF1B1
MTTRVRVAVRCRPLVEKEINEGCESCATIIDESQVLLGKDKCFTYDYAFGATVTQEEVFQNCGYPLVEAIFKGFNATMLAYGQTGSGKTYTMGSAKIVESTDEETLGIIPRVVEQLFAVMKEREKDYEYVTKVSFLEIYNEEIKDLLADSPDNQTLAIREDGHGIKIFGLTENEVAAPTEAMSLLCQGGDSRATGSTKMNEQSSRSHAIFTLTIQQQSRTQAEDNWSTKFHLVDLAGSERIKKTGAEGDRRKEGININLGLLALGNVVSALGDDKRKISHIPYRDSKLTRLLQDSLGGNSYTLMMACISPADSNMEETLNTLRYADRAKRIKNKPIVNRDPHVAEILRLKSLVAQLQSDAVTGLSSNDLISSLEYKKLKEKSDLLEEQNEKLANELTNAIDHSNELCEKIVLMEMSRDKLKARLHKITINTGMSVEELDSSLKDSELASDLREKLEKVRAIQREICELDKDKASLECTLSELHDSSLTTVTEMAENVTAGTQSTEQTSTSTLTPSDIEQQLGEEESDVYAKTYTLHRAKMSRQLKDLNDMLATKERLIEESVTAEQRQESLKHQQTLEKKIKSLEDEKEKLSHQLTSNKSSAAIGKISEQRRLRLKELEQQMSDLKRKLKEQSRIAKMKEQTDKQLERLNKEIVSMKQQRVQLMKRIKEESENFRKWKLEQDKKMVQMKARERKRECEVAKMELHHAKSQAFYKRKAEEAAVANKRLKESLERQKQSRERNIRTAEKDLAGVGPRVKSLVNDEIDMMVSVKEAERYLQDQQAQRAELHKHLRSLQSGTSDLDTEGQRKAYQTQLSLCTAAISDFNQKLQDAKGAKSQPLSERLTSMVEAKCAIRHLLNLSVKNKLESLVTQSTLKETSSTADSDSRRVTQLEKELAELEEYHYNEIMVMTTNFDRKLAAMKSELEKHDVNTSSLDIQSMQLDVTSLNEEIEEKNRTIAALEKKLEDVSMLAAQTPHHHHKQHTPKSGLPGERFPHVGSLASPYLDKVVVSTNQPADTKIKMKTKASRTDNKLTVISKIKTVHEDESLFSDTGLSDVENDDPHDLSWHVTPEVKRMRRTISFTKCSCTTHCRSKLCGCFVRQIKCGPLCGCKLDPCLNAMNEQTTTGTASSTSASRSYDQSLVSEAGAEHIHSTLNTTFEVDKSETISDVSLDSKNLPKMRRDNSSSLLAGKRRKLHSTDSGMYFGSPV